MSFLALAFFPSPVSAQDKPKFDESTTKLVVGHYRAKLIEPLTADAYLDGTGEWQLAHAGSTTRWLPVEPMQLALKNLHWEDDRPAELTIGEQGPESGLRLNVAKPGRLNFGWSLRGVVEPGEQRFDLQVPAAPVNRLELDLPMGFRPYPSQEMLIDGPTKTGENYQRWRLVFSGQSRLAFSIRRDKANDATVQKTVRSRTGVKQTIGTGQILYDWDFDLEIGRSGVVQLSLFHDAGLTIRDVQFNHRFTWAIEPGANPASKCLRIHLSEPARGGRLQVQASSALPPEGTSWISPTMRIGEGVQQSEIVELKVSPEWKVEHWQPGTFRTLSDWNVALDGTRTISLQRALPPAGQPEQRPSLQLSASGAEFDGEQQFELTILADRCFLRQQAQLPVKFGNLHSLHIQIPKDWEVERIELPSSELPPEWQLRGFDLFIELNKAYLAGTTAKLDITYRRKIVVGSGYRLPFPTANMVGASSQNSSLKVVVAPAMSLDVGLSGGNGLSDFFRRNLREFRWPGSKAPSFPLLVSKKSSNFHVHSEEEAHQHIVAEPKWLYAVLEVRAEGDSLVGRLRGRISRKPNERSILRIQPGVEIREILIEGRPRTIQADDAIEDRPLLPLPDRPADLNIEMIYRIPLRTGWLSADCDHLLPVEGEFPVRIDWRLPSSLRYIPSQNSKSSFLEKLSNGPFAFERTDRIRLGLEALVALLIAGCIGMIRFRALKIRRATVPAVTAIFILLLVAPLSVLWCRQPVEQLTQEFHPTAVVLDAEYTGWLREASAEFLLDWKIASKAGGAPFRFSLPEARLRSVTLNGKAAFPKPIGNDRYEVDLPEFGEYRLQATVDAPIVDIGSDFEIHFGVPELPQARLCMFLPMNVQQPRALNPRGLQYLRPTLLGNALLVDLGRSKVVQIRWRDEDIPPRLELREAHLLEIATGTIGLLSAWDIDVKQGSVRKLKVNVPVEWQVVRVEIRPDLVAPAASTTTVKEWGRGLPDNGWSELFVDLHSAIGGRFCLLIECVPVRQPTQLLNVRLPHCKDATSLDGYFGYKQTGWKSVALEDGKTMAEMPIEPAWRETVRPLFGQSTLTSPERLWRRMVRNNPAIRINLQ